MLTELIVRNLAIIDRLQIGFGPGLNVLTGETGAGKSILIGALQLLLGGRARADLIRSGEEEASVQAVFSPVSDAFTAALQQADIPVDEELILRRTLNRNGKNRIYVNGELVTLSQWQPLGQQLVAIYGQHEHQALLNKDNHLQLLDDFAQIAPVLHDYQAVYKVCRDLQQRLDRLNADDQERQQRLDLLQYQVNEIQTAGFQPDEEEALEQERRLLANAEQLRTAADGGYESLYGAQGAVTEQIDQAAVVLERLQGISPELDAVYETLRSCQYQLEDAAQQLRHYGSQLEFDPQRQDQVESRLDLLQRLLRKYAADIPSLLEYVAQAEQELDALSHCDENRVRWQQELDEQQRRLQQAADRLGEQRRQAAGELQQSVERELADLGMEKASFEVCFSVTKPGPRGCETAEFFLSANTGEEARPLIRVASGGELSRILLAIRRATPDRHAVATAIFDEVDAGIGGVTATAVGQKLKQVAAQGQVLCVTHLPQVASFADHHYRIEKSEHQGRTRTKITALHEEERVVEMARLLGGSHQTEQSIVHAREMIDQAGKGCA